MKTVDLDNILQVARVSINRAYIFSALSDKIKETKVPSIDLVRGCVFGLVPHEVWLTNQDDYKEGFQGWVANKCIEDMIESLENVMVYLYEVLPVSTEAPSKYQIKNFKRSQSIQERIRTLEKIGIDVDCVDSIVTLAKVRNCLTHRQGFVGDEDIKKSGGQFKCIWYFVSAEAVGIKHGKECVVNMETPLFTPHFDNRQAEVVIKWTKRERVFAKGERICFAAHEIQEICFTVTNAVNSLCRNFLTKVEEWGAVITRTPNQKT